MRIGIIGLGSMGLKHARHALADGHDVTGFDPDLSAREALAAAGGVAVDSVDGLLAAAEAVVVASPPRFHLPQCATAIAAGRHVLVEKPLADRIGDLPVIVENARAAGLVFAVAQNLRYHPAVRAARVEIEQGRIGRPLNACAIGMSPLVDWRPGSDHRSNYAADPRSGGVIFDWVHEIDLLAFLLGPFQATGASAANSGVLGIAAEETATLMLRHEAGTLSMIMLSYLGRPARRVTEIHGSAGRLEIDIPARRLRVWGVDAQLIRETAFGGQHADDYVSELRAFVRAASGSEAPGCTAEEAGTILRQVLRLRDLAGLPAATDHERQGPGN